MSDEDDEFGAYDFSEFSEKDLAEIDAHLTRAHGGPAIQIALQDSPFHNFLSWKKHLAVTDLVSPLWCELQHEYGLYGSRHKPLRLRPASFTSRNGKHIHVRQHVAHANDRRLRRGKSVHKALENELSPEKLVVRVVSEEERFGLRLVRLIDGFNQLVANGITRELPVFAITHAQVVLGVIDEVLLTQVGRDQPDASPPPATPSCSPSNAKQRLASAPIQEQTNSTLLDLPPRAFTAGAAEQANDPTHVPSMCIPGQMYELRILDYKTRRSSNVPLDGDSVSSRIQLMMYHRMLSTLLQPEAFDFDLLWKRLNLNPMKPFSVQFLNDIIWEQRQVDPTDCNVHLNRLVSEWISTTRKKTPDFVGVSQQLQIVYRHSVLVGKQQAKGRTTEIVDVDDPLEALVCQEELHLACAIEESLSAMGHQGARQVADCVAQNVRGADPSFVGRISAVWQDLISSLDSGPADPALVWATQESLLTCARNPFAQGAANILQCTNTDRDETTPGATTSEEPAQDRSTAEISPIIGTKEFKMDDDELDARLADVLQWWLGARPARGVDINQSNRCFTCEYQDSCEWREQKAREARRSALERRISEQSRNRQHHEVDAV